MKPRAVWTVSLAVAFCGLTWAHVVLGATRPATKPGRKAPAGREILRDFHQGEPDAIVRPAPLAADEPNTTDPQTRPASREIVDRLPPESPASPFGAPRPSAPAVLPSTPGQPKAPAGVVSPVSPNIKERPVIAEGRWISVRPGRLIKMQGAWAFAFESKSTEHSDPPLPLLPCQQLELMEAEAVEGQRSPVFVVTGEITEYHGQNYLLPRIVQVRRGSSNLER